MKSEPYKLQCKYCGKHLAILGVGSILTKSCPDCGSVYNVRTKENNVKLKVIKIGDKMKHNYVAS